ncbi:MAG: hypothetical protein WAW80_01215 [Candidatus Saccharimonadales bacterium]
MYTTVLNFYPSKKIVTIVAFLMLSLLIAAYTPMAAISSAQSAIDTSKIKELKTKALAAITERIKHFETTLGNLDAEASTSPSPSSAASVTPSPSPSIAVGASGFDMALNFPDEIKTKAKEFLQKIVEQLKGMKEKVSSASSLESMQSLTSNLDAQSGLSQLTNIQAAVTQSIQSLTGVFDNLKTVGKDLKSQLAQMKSCIKGTEAGAGGDAGAIDNSGADTEDCKGLNTSSTQVADDAESKLGSIDTILKTIGSVLTSCITLLMSLVSTFTGMIGGIGGSGGLGNLSNLSSLTSSADISSLTSSLGGVGSLLTSFTGLSSQLDLTSGLAGSAQGLMGNLTGLINL